MNKTGGVMPPNMNYKYMYFVIFMVLSFYFRPAYADICDNWFKDLNIKQDKNCLTTCTAAKVNLGTFHCPSECDHLCKSSQKEKVIFNLADLYPGLTFEEKALCAKEPVKMLKAYNLTWKAEEICLTIFPSSQTNDESDACRHYVWASLLYEQFGTEFGAKVLNAHEQDPKQPTEEKAMDLANNRLGLITAEQLKKRNKLNDNGIASSFKDDLKNGRLIILRKSQGEKR